MNDEVKKLYSALLGKGYSTSDLGDEETFRAKMSDKNSRKELYDWVSSKGNFRLGDYESYENRLTSSMQQPEQPAAAPTVPEVETPATPTGETPLTEQDKRRFSAGIEQMKRRTQQSMDEFNERMETMREYHENAPLGGGQTAEGRMMFNPQSGKVEKTYITPLGNRYTSKGLADMESFRYRQAADMSVGGQLRRARQKLAELQEQRKQSGLMVDKEWQEFNETKLTPLGRLLIGGDMYRGMQQGDGENAALNVAIRQTEELIKNLEEQQDRDNGVDVGFWRGFGRTMSDFRTWDFGMSDMMDAMTMMNAENLTGENATEGERAAYDEMMGAIYNKEQAEQQYGGNAGFWNWAGVMIGYMPSFMIDFALTGGGYGGIKVFGKQATKGATKIVGKEVVEEIAKQGVKSYVKNNGIKGFGQVATNWTIKALGTTADDLLIRAPLMTNTVQMGKTGADIIDRKLGNVVIDENGNYDFSNDATWGDAVWQGEANSIIENYSEMFGTHLDPVITFGNMSKLANVVGAKRLGAVLSKADAGALSGIMGQTHQLFNKMGVSDYFGEVTEEYYGQMWRTMLNLDDAYQQNPDGTRTNLLATGQFHGDIWGGMALSMGLMGAGKHTISAAQYASMKHGVNKADAAANELFGAEMWEPLRTTIDLTTNENIGEVADLIVNDKDMTNEEKAAALNYMERSLYMRGFNLGTMAKARSGEQSEEEQIINESFLDGYNATNPQEMNDAKNLYEYHRQQLANIVSDDFLASIDADPLGNVDYVRTSEEWNDDERAQLYDYINARQVYQGMIQRVRDDIDGKIDQSNAMIAARANRTTGMIQGATMKQDDRRVYVISGNLVPYEDGTGIDISASDGSIIVRDAETGALEQVSPESVLSIDEAQDPYEQQQLAADAIRVQFAQDAANKIDGVVSFNPGDTYTIAGADGNQAQVQVTANEMGIVDNGDGTVNVTDGVNVFPLAKEIIQQSADAANIARVAEFEQQRAIENLARQQAEAEAVRPQYAMNDLVTLRDENGNGIRGNITADADADGRYEVYTEDAVNGKRVNLFTRDELDAMLMEHNGQVIEQSVPKIEENAEKSGESVPETVETVPTEQPQVSALSRIPQDEQGNPIYEQAETPDLAWDAIVEQTEGDEVMAQTVADGMVADMEAALKKIEKSKAKGGTTIAEKIAAEKERNAAIEDAKGTLAIWKSIAQTAQRRKSAAEAERRRIIEEQAALRRAEEEKLRAEQEEAARIEREALNGVPDMADDTPQDARARGYRRLAGHKIDRQQPIQHLQGKEVEVKFSDEAFANGRVAVIDAAELQPSHIQGMRNPAHFIDEAQPKERNDEVSVMSARKIAGNIRPEEITTSVTAYTGAPTVNTRGEVIQGNNRSDALRLMWESEKEQAAIYKQYLKDHADEFGLNAEEIEAMQSPVLVNMLDVEDADAITLGQFVAQDTESGGIERIKPKNAVQKMGAEMRSFANLLLRSADEETSFAGLVDANGTEVLRWMNQRGYITPTQYKSAFDSKGAITAEAKNDLKGIMYQSIFQGGNTRLEEMFNAMPSKAQRAILATAFRDYDSPNAERMVEEIQNSIRAYNALSQDAAFASAKNWKEARMAVEGWKKQYAMDDVTGESFLPAEKFSNFALHLATMYKGESQGIIQNTFNHLYDLIQGTQEETLFEKPDNTPRSLAQAIFETLNFEYNGQLRNNVLAVDSSASQQGRQGSDGNPTPRERIESGEQTADHTGGTESGSEQSQVISNTNEYAGETAEAVERNNDEQRQADGGRVADDAPGEMAQLGSRGDIRVFEEGLGTSLNEHYEYSERNRREAESERLVGIAKQHGLFIPAKDTAQLGEKHGKRTGESVVYYDEAKGIVVKVKDPYAKAALKNGVQPEDAIYEHIVHNLLFPETEYSFIGISEELGDVRIILSQKYLLNHQHPTKEQIAEALAAKGLYPEDNYSFGNELVSVTDVEGDNVLLGDDGTVYFIDPIIRFKKPVQEVIAALSGTTPTETETTTNNKVTDENAASLVGKTIVHKDSQQKIKFTGHRTDPKFGIIYEGKLNNQRAEFAADLIAKMIETGMWTEENGAPLTLGQQIAAAEAETNTNPTEAQKEAGNYKKGHIQVGTFNVTIENPKGSIRSGVDANGEKWETEMQNTYGYIRGTEGVDGDHIDVFLSNDIDGWNGTRVFIIDQYNPDGTFDEHKVMLGFNEQEEAEAAFLSNYDEEWAAGRRLDGSSVLIEDFEKWIASSHRKTKPFAEYKSVKNVETSTVAPGNNEGYTVEPAQYTTKRGKVLDMHLVKFGRELTKEEQRNAKALAKELKGWYDSKQGGFMMRSAEDAQQIVDAIMDESGETLADAAPVSLSDVRKVNVDSLMGALSEQGEATLSEHSEPLISEQGAKADLQIVRDAVGKTFRNSNGDLMTVNDYKTNWDERKQLHSVTYVIDGKEQGRNILIPELANALASGNWVEVEQPKNEGALGLVSDARMEELKARLRKKLGGQLNMGIDPEILAIGMELAAGHIDRGVKSFADFAKRMVEDLGDVIRPYLKAFYNGARDMPEIVENGLAAEMTPYDEVSSFDVANFDKAHSDPFATAEMVVSEQEKIQQAEEAKKEIVNQRNTERRKDNEQTSANTETIASQAEAVAIEAESRIETATDEKQLNEIVSTLDEQLEAVNEQLALLGFYEAEENEKDFNEMYGYMRNAEKKAVRNANELADKLIADLGIERSKIVDKKGKKRKSIASANIAPAGGDISFRLPLTDNRELYFTIQLTPDYLDNLEVTGIMFRIENPTESGYKQYVGQNTWADPKATYDAVLRSVRYQIKARAPEFNVTTPTPFEEKKKDETTENKPIKENKKKKNSVTSHTELADLFGGLFNEETLNNQEDERQSEKDIRRTGSRTLAEDTQSAGSQREGSGEKGLGEADRQRILPSQGGNSGASKHVEQGGVDSNLQGRRNDGRGDSSLSRGESEGTEPGTNRPIGRLQGLESDIAPSERKNTYNNHSERGANHAPTSVDARIEANIKTIELAQQLIESGEQATEQQMKTLRKFSGWGGLGKAFSDSTYSARIQELLGAEAYQEAVMSANSAYYTPAYVVDTLWDIATQMGFKGGNILEGSAGIGNILGQMPTSISERSDIHAIEIDRTSGGILSLLYPDAKVEIQGFEDTRIPNGSVDLAITNVPFVTGLRVNDTTGDKDLSKKFHNIHDFCIAKNVRKLREGGIGLFITSNGTLDNSKKLRDWIVNEGGADFIGAFRMHNKTFGGTGVTSDIIVIRKRVNGRKSANAIDVSTITGERSAEFDTGEKRKVKGEEVAIIKHLAMDYNRYFIEHPENMAGVMQFAFEQGETFRPTSKGLYPAKGKNQEQMLAEFVGSFQEENDDITTTETSSKGGREYIMDTSADGKKLGELYVKDGKLVIAGAGGYYPLSVNANKVKGHTKVECFNAYAAIKEALAEVLAYQTENESNEGLKPLLAKLNKAYDSFVKAYGHFNKNTAIAFLKNDVDYANVSSVETYKEEGDGKGGLKQIFGKADVMNERVVEKEKEPTPTNVKDGIIASVFKFGRIDAPYIAEQLGKSVDEVKSEIIESGYGFEDPATRQMELSYQYLSGNVREKLRQAQENNESGAYDGNIKALQEVIPMDIPAHLIDFTLGSSWIDPKLYEEYIQERTEIEVKLTSAGGTWYMDAPYYVNKEKNRSMGVYSEQLRKTIFGHTLIEAAIQNKTITVSESHKKWDGTTETITDKEATQACASKIDEIRLDFKDWARAKMQSDADMSAAMERIYNDMFNNYVAPKIPEEFTPKYFVGASHKFEMRPHQKRAIVRGTMQPLMLAHEVGSGKTFTLISTAMEMRRLGTARKPMIVVQNATVGQFVANAKELYPNAKILTLEEADRSAEGRKNFYAKIRHNDWDMIVVPQSTFEFIPDSEERQMQFVQDKIAEKMAVLEKMQQADPRGESMITRQAKKEIADLEAQLADLSEQASSKRSAAAQKKREVTLQNAEVQALEMLDRRTDDVENFDDMGIDALLVDEAHEYKHLGFATAMQRGVKGVDASYSKKSQGVYLKTQAVLEKNNGRNVIFATGTPISNTAAEIWTFMRYLMPADTMKEYGIYYFDDFVRNFGNIQQMLEFTTSGKFKENNRFAGYVNLPELVRIWSGVSDTVRFEEIEEDRKKQGKPDLRPEIEGGKAQDLYLPQTRALRSIMKFVKAELMRYEEMSGKEKKENSHIPLTMYGIAKSAAVDARLVDAEAEDDTNSKTNEAVRQTLRSLKETAKYKGTVAIFSDNYQNKASGFNLYDDIREKLIAEGVSADEVVVIRSGMTVKKKLEIFEKVNRGEIRVVLGSTFTLGTGVNIQERLHTVIHLDAPNRPMDYTQRNGRIHRQGNKHKEWGIPIRILRMGVEDSLDVTAYQRLKTKGAIADSIMNSKEMLKNSQGSRVLEEEEDVFGDTVAQLSGSEYAMLKNNAEKNVRKYESRKKGWEADQTYIHNAKPRYRGQIAEAEQRAETNRKFLQAVQEAFPGGKFTEITAGKQTFATVEDMADFFKEHNKKVLEKMKQMKEGGEDTHTRELTVTLGGYTFKMRTELNKESSRNGGQLFAEVHRKMTYSCPELGLEDVPVHQNLLRNAIEDIVTNVITGKDYAERAEAAERKAKHLQSELEQLLSREGVPFEFEEELAQARAQYAEYSELMKKEMEEKEAKYAEMDATVEAANDLATAEEADELEREGDGAYTDDEVSFENDPISKVLGKPRFTRKQRREFAERERQRMVARVENLAKKLNLDNVEIVTDASTLEGKKQRAKGFYTKSTGKITIVIPNHSSAFDVEQTLLHEAVAHYGLRQLFGEHFETFLDNVFNNADEAIRQRIVALAAKNGWDFHKATEEYLAMLAENTEFENTNASWWRQIKDFFLNMLHKIGFEDFRGVTLTDNELRYILWRSYENLKDGKHSSLFGEAADIAMQHELRVGEFADTSADDVLHRDGDTPRERYDKEVRTFTQHNNVKWNQNLPNRLIESYQDSMRAVDILQRIVAEESGSEILSFENARQAENAMSSSNKSQAEAYNRDFYTPIIQTIQDLVKQGADYEDIKAYVIAKHGLERNVRMATDKAEEAFAKYQNEHPKGQKTLQDFIDEYRKSDYAGLTSLTGMKDVADAEAEAERMVSVFENEYNSDNLWDKINAATKETLKKSYDSGMMSKATYEKVRDMYQFYVPLRGWNIDVAANEYEYLTNNHLMLSPALKKAGGRSSLADDPIATIGYMAESSIIQGNRNKMKQKFLNMALNHQSELLSVSKQWYVKKGADEWIPESPVIPDDATGDKVADIIEQHELDMQELEKQGLATTKRRGLKLDLHTTKREGQEHVVRVMRNGEEFCIYVNGNPRAAQAINGLTNPHSSESGIAQAGMIVKNWMARAFTSWNPAFVVSNLSRDVIWATSAVMVKEDSAYAKQYMKNVSGALLKMKLPVLLKKYKDGTLDNSIEIERYFGEFIRNGGETGFTQLNTVEDFKRNIERAIKDAQGKTSKLKKGWNAAFDGIEFMNRAVEDISRFSVYMTSRQMGRDVARSVWDAKEITVNFNKKGSGGLGAKYMNFAYIFFNATIQSLANFGKLLYRHPKKMMALLSTVGASGLVIPLVNALLMSLLGDDDDEKAYWDLPEWVRRNNIVLWNPFSDRGFLTIPLPHELRPFYGMGEIAVSVMQGKEDAEEGLKKSVLGFTSMLPFDLTANGGFDSSASAKDNLGNLLVNVSPTIIQPVAQYFNNKDYFGVPIYKDNDWNKLDPEWTKAYKGTAPWLVNGTRWLNRITSEDDKVSGDIDWNPALIEHLFESYLGGTGKTISRTAKTIQMLWDEDLREWRNVPVASSFYQVPNERNAGSQTNREYWNAVDDVEDTAHKFKTYRDELKMGAVEYAEKLDELMKSEVFKRYLLVRGYKNAINKISSNLKYVDASDREAVETRIMELKAEMLEKLDSLDNRK